MRKIRLETKEEVKVKEAVASKFRDHKTLLELPVEEVSKTITKDELQDLVDRACLMDELIKEKQALLSKMKERLMSTAKVQGWKEMETQVGLLKITADTKLDVPVKALVELLRSLDKAKLFQDLVSVKMTEATRYLGRDALEKIGTKAVEPYGRMTLKTK